MTWDSFYKWLEAHNIRWSPGDMHYDGAGFWYPQPPDLRADRVPGEPLTPPPPWIHIFKSSIEDGRKTTTTVDVMTSFSPAHYSIENPADARELVEQAMMGFDTAAGAGPAMQRRLYTEPAQASRAGRGRPMSAENLRLRDEFEAEMNALPRNKRPAGGPIQRVWEANAEESMKRWNDMIESRKWEPARRPAAESPLYKGEPLKMKGYGAATPDDSDVSDSCDLGAHERCGGCGCGCHRPAWKVKTCSCGQSFTREEWESLPYLGRQKLEATADEPACELEARNCSPGCGSTLYAEI